MVVPEKFTAETIHWIRPWAPNLFSFRITRPAGFRFSPGQFARLGVRVPDPNNPKNPTGEKIVWRAYSVASAADADELEFFSIVIPGGEFTPALARLRLGDTVYCEKTSYGFLTTDRFENGKDLWLLSTGTGLAPFLSMLWDRRNWESYENLIVVHSVRYPNELAYAQAIEAFRQERKGQARLHYVPVVTRATVDAALRGRIQDLVSNGELERAAGVKLDHERSRLMLCGNPGMVDETRKRLTAMGFRMSRRGNPGHLAVENYW